MSRLTEILSAINPWRRYRGPPVTSDYGLEWRPGAYEAGDGLPAFRFRYREMNVIHRSMMRPVEDQRIIDGEVTPKVERMCTEAECEIMSECVLLPNGDGDRMEATTADAIKQIGGQGGSAFVHMRRLVLAPYYREVQTGERKKKLLRRSRYMRRGLTLLRRAAEIV